MMVEDVLISGRDGADHALEGGKVVLREVGAGADLGRASTEVGVIELGDDDDAGLRMTGHDVPGGDQPAYRPHLDVHDDPIGPLFLEDRLCFRSIRCLTHVIRRKRQ